MEEKVQEFEIRRDTLESQFCKHSIPTKWMMTTVEKIKEASVRIANFFLESVTKEYEDAIANRMPEHEQEFLLVQVRI